MASRCHPALSAATRTEMMCRFRRAAPAWSKYHTAGRSPLIQTPCRAMWVATSDPCHFGPCASKRPDARKKSKPGIFGTRTASTNKMSQSDRASEHPTARDPNRTTSRAAELTSDSSNPREASAVWSSASIAGLLCPVIRVSVQDAVFVQAFQHSHEVLPERCCSLELVVVGIVRGVVRR